MIGFNSKLCYGLKKTSFALQVPMNLKTLVSDREHTGFLFDEGLLLRVIGKKERVESVNKAELISCHWVHQSDCSV